MVTALNAEFLRDLSYVAEDEGLMKKLSKYVHRLLEKKKDETLFTEEEFRRKLEHSSAQAAQGKYIEMRADESVDQFIDRLLCM
ncbi:MAG: hypothetical protein IJS73_04905 [Paludibacteraceae bacterium]|nr:hypothetical protein [Paludibacteraceae bacterium]